MKQTLINWASAVAAMSAFLGAAAMIDGPSDAEVEQAIAADLKAAQRQELRLSQLTRRCFKERGPAAELIQIEGSDDYVCREREIEPTPAAILQRYAMLESRK